MRLKPPRPSFMLPVTDQVRVSGLYISASLSQVLRQKIHQLQAHGRPRGAWRLRHLERRACFRSIANYAFGD